MSSIRTGGTYTVTLPAFEGPLDLLLQLIEREKLDITKIALAQVADQYLAHVRALAAPDPRSLAEFVALAARLLLIKSRALLPAPAAVAAADAGATVDDAEALARQLEEYQRYKQIALLLRAWQEQGRQTFLRMAGLPELLPVPDNAGKLDHTPAELVEALERRIQLALPLDTPIPVNVTPRLTVAEVVSRIRTRLATQPWFLFADLLALSTTRQEIAVTFWAVLELWKHRIIVIEQESLFGPINIGRGAALNDTGARIEIAPD